MNACNIAVKVPKGYRFVTTIDGHCHEIASAYIKAEFKPETILISKEGRKVSSYDIANHAGDVFHAIDDVVFHKGNEYHCCSIDGCDAMFGMNYWDDVLKMIVATIDEKGNLVLLPYDEQKPIREFLITDEHRETFKEYQKRLKGHNK